MVVFIAFNFPVAKSVIFLLVFLLRKLVSTCDFDEFIKEFSYKIYNEEKILFCEQTFPVEPVLYVPHCSYLTR